MIAQPPASGESVGRLDQLLAFLETDPGNVRLLLDAAQAAFDEARFDEAEALLARHAGVGPLPAPALHLRALVAMRREDWSAAASQLAVLMATEDAPPIRFNRAWSLAMLKQFDEALELLDSATTEALPQAAQLLVQLLHDRGDMAEAESQARRLFALHPHHRGLAAAVATLAVDIEDLDLARRAAEAAGDHPDALATLGTLALDEDRSGDAARYFDAALERAPASPRALVGRGLVHLLSEEKKAQAARDIDAGAELFGTHLGSWIAAGWAHVLAGDPVSGRARFEHALALDDRFAESHGSLAVIDVLAGDLARARQRCEIALRLDRKCFSAALAATLLSAGAGDVENARRIFETALHTPVEAGGRTIAQSLARMGARSG
jgi:tetratricopeptide (TPR) repeat protein